MTGAWFRHRRLPGRLGVVGVTRLLVFQVILVGMVVVAVQGLWVAVLGELAGALAIAATLGRWHGRWSTEHARLWLRHRLRRGAASAPADDPAPDDPRLAAMGSLVSDLAVEKVAGPESGSEWGMGSDGAGWFAVLEVESAGGGVHPPVPLSTLAQVATDTKQAGVVLQVLSQSIREQRVLWVAVRLDSHAVADSMVDSLLEEPDGQQDVPAVLAEITRRVGRGLARRGLSARLLDADAVLDALVRSCDLSPGEDQPAAWEAWDAWHSGRLAHRCYWLKEWPDAERGTSLLASLVNLPDAQVSVALLLEPQSAEQAEMQLRCLVRVAADSARHRQVGEEAERLAERLGGRLFALDGEHALAVYCSAPSGGGAR